jgi:hypothetical protein
MNGFGSFSYMFLMDYFSQRLHLSSENTLNGPNLMTTQSPFFEPFLLMIYLHKNLSNHV